MAERIELEGERVRLRTTVPGDGPAPVAIRATEAVRNRWRGDDLQAEVAADLADDEVVQLTIEADGAIIGLIQFFEEQDPDYRSASLDISIDPAVHRRGYASDAIRTVADHLFDRRGHHRLTIDPAVDNQPAIRCYSSVGFRPVGVMRGYERRADGSWADGLFMEMLAGDRVAEARAADGGRVGEGRDAAAGTSMSGPRCSASPASPTRRPLRPSSWPSDRPAALMARGAHGYAGGPWPTPPLRSSMR